MKLMTHSITLALGLAFSAGAMAQDMSYRSYSAAKDTITTEYKSDKAHCDPLSGNSKDICMAEAKGKEDIARAELDARRKNTAKNHYDVHAAKAEAAYAVAKEKCDDRADNAKDVCLKEAKAIETRDKANAEARMKVWNADVKSNKETSDTHMQAAETKSDARQDAALDKRDANYDVAKEKCDNFSGDAKVNCVAQAKQRYGKK